MKKTALLTVSVLTLASMSVFTDAFAQEKTRAEVRQELIQAEDNGLQYVTDASYPAIDPAYAQLVAQRAQQADSGVGADMSGTCASGSALGHGIPR
jgi:hypothetical protein